MTNFVTLGKTNIQVHPIGLGANAVGGHNIYPDLDEENGIQVVKKAMSHGMNFIDTAFSYGMGRSEELVGQALQETGGRRDMVIATKGAHRITEGNQVIDNSPDFLKQSVEDSLKRLQTDYIDVFFIHQPDADTPKYEAIGALKELKDAGIIRAIGVSNFSLHQLIEANQDGYVDVYQGGYNLLNRTAETEYFPYMEEHTISFMPYFPLVSGLLAGKYNAHTTFPDGDIRNRQSHFQGEQFQKNLAKIEKLREIASAKDVEVVHIVLAWYLTRPAIDVVIPGAKKPEQVVNNLKTMDVQLSKEEVQRIDDIFQS